MEVREQEVTLLPRFCILLHFAYEAPHRKVVQVHLHGHVVLQLSGSQSVRDVEVVVWEWVAWGRR